MVSRQDDRQLKFEFVVDELTRQSKDGRLKPGDKLPSIRKLTETYGCSKNTILRAYAELERRHLVYAVPKSGYFLLDSTASPSSPAPVGLPIDMRSASPEGDWMPYLDVQQCLTQAIERYRDDLFAYGDTQGLLTLRSTLTRHFADDQVFAKTEDIFVVSGSHQALSLLVEMPFPNGKTNVLIEQPTYFGAMQAAGVKGITMIGIERAWDGINLEELERHFQHNNIKCFYTVSRFHNPLGCSYSKEQKQAIVRLAAQYDVYVIEDDYLADLDPDGKADPMFAYDREAHVIYVKSFSKVMLPGLRLGAVALPKKLAAAFHRYKQAADLFTPALSQGALELYIASGMFASHTKRLRKLYSARMSALQSACRRALPSEAAIQVPESGVFATLALPEQVSASKLCERLEAEGVLTMNVDRLLLPAFRHDRMIRLSVMRANEQAIDAGIAAIAREMQKLRIAKPTSHSFREQRI
ncbi:aminotransferase-like domain-containing protein [Cohnella rhizosphaerae]|uniref:PLP-dependent aminotransferase family protein n=1 Tax=Cohnella rhizosphaerae TaxID=1457232 RepID=A0A9X4QUX6_9BACL|nr:PLP-dependent aminotransferase family protein [Cohnella rhizosphaerae]MDG0812711.1 PLP-dependent aminotransferase family protein [Cohnella rhizosphaerae]